MFRHPFINWKEEGEWSVANPSMYINDAGQVVYKELKTETGKAEAANTEELGRQKLPIRKKPWLFGASKPKERRLCRENVGTD